MRVLVAVIVLAACGRLDFDPVDSLELMPPTARSNLNTRTQFVATGGFPPYAFAVASGGGAIDPASGMFRAPPYPGSARVQAVDAAGDVASADISFGGDYVYFIGGASTVPHPEVWRSTDGIAWQVVGQLPEPRLLGALFVLDDEMFYAGGSDNDINATSRDEVWRSRDGISWSLAGRLPVPLHSCGDAVFRDRVWVVGGLSSPEGFSPVVVTSNDGAVWRDESRLPVGLHNGKLLPYHDQLFMIGGHTGTGSTLDCRVTTDGQTWPIAGQLPVAPADYHATYVFRDRMWAAGGGLGVRVISSTDCASWLEADPIPAARLEGQLVELDGALWMIGGSDPPLLESPDGTGWVARGVFPATLMGGRVVLFTPPGN